VPLEDGKREGKGWGCRARPYAGWRHPLPRRRAIQCSRGCAA